MNEETVKNGGNITHILRINVIIDASETDVETKKGVVLDYIYEYIHKKAIKRNYKSQVIEVMWEHLAPIHEDGSTNQVSKTTYYTESLLFSDLGIKAHTSIMMNDLCIFAKNAITDFAFSIHYQVEKPLSKQVVLL